MFSKSGFCFGCNVEECQKEGKMRFKTNRGGARKLPPGIIGRSDCLGKGWEGTSRSAAAHAVSPRLNPWLRRSEGFSTGRSCEIP